MLYGVECLWPGWTTECEVVKNGVVKSLWREITVWCGMSWCDFKCFVVWIYKIQCSEQFALSVLCSVQCNAVQYCLSVSMIQCTQCSVSVYSVG